eukprot:TRINITY_DN3138_c0_g1_i1.p1 TRINITY_DN3138_c0_g1~~TRINITY_DN3138_c0_g1_i1.p1  ORF type:complete len:559 (+),score=177.22 TRINITY_DN3138_c0_g1_i1:136-1812(+)
MNLTSILPTPKHTFRDDYGPVRALTSLAPTSSISNAVVSTRKGVPPYGARKGFIPRSVEDFGDGGAFPEIHVAQYPLDMGRKDAASTQKSVPLTTDGEGRIKYEAILNPGSDKQIMARHEDLSAKRFDEEELRRPDPEEEAEITARTKAAIEQVTSSKIAAAAPAAGGVGGAPTFIRYTPSQKGAGFNSGTEQRIIRLSEAPVDPLEPPKFKLKKAPRGPPSPPVPVMHSPPRKLTLKDQQDWKIPPCISNWKNNKGYTIPLDKRLAADGRGLQDVQINDNFAKLSESLYIAERSAREEVAKRAEVDKRLKLKEKEKKEEMLRRLAQEARMERSATQMEVAEDDDEEDSRRERDQIREERRRERERDLRMQRNKSQAARNADRDVSEKVALGMAVGAPSTEALYDQRLFNQTQGMSSGFGDDESYNIYSKPLFQGSAAGTHMLHRPKKDADLETYGGEEDLKKLHDTSKFKPDKGFSGVDAAQTRSGPLEFEQPEADPFGLDEFLKEAKSSSKVLDKIGSAGHMKVSSANTETASEGGSKRGRINFEASGGDDKRRRH